MSAKFKLKRIRDGEEFEIGLIAILVGRSDSCDITVTEGFPSREHARIAEREGGVMVQDLHSTNGTFVNNKQIEEATILKAGDVVKFGDEAFSVQSTEAPEATVMMRSLGVGSNTSATVIDEDEDEDDQDSTSFLEIYSLPQGWDDGGGGFNNQVGKLDEKKRAAIDRYVERFSQSLKGKTGIFLIFFREDNPPEFKSLMQADERTVWSFGRSSECDVSFDDPCISKHHADIRYESGGWSIHDKQSTNGLLLEGKRTPSIALKDDHTFEISTVEVLVRKLKLE
ncbi:MAG: FHA domain-containing protein [Agarilytica sp.]